MGLRGSSDRWHVKELERVLRLRSSARAKAALAGIDFVFLHDPQAPMCASKGMGSAQAFAVAEGLDLEEHPTASPVLSPLLLHARTALGTELTSSFRLVDQSLSLDPKLRSLADLLSSLPGGGVLACGVQGEERRDVVADQMWVRVEMLVGEESE